GAELAEANRQIAVAARAILINQDVARTVHGLELVFQILEFAGRKHALLEEIGVPGGVPKIEARDMRSKNEIIAAAQVLVAHPVFHDLADQSAFWMPEDQAWTGFVLNAEQIEFATQLAMVALARFFEARHVLVAFL